MSAKRESLIELKGAMLPILSVILRSLDLDKLRQEAHRMFGDEAFFDGDLAALDLGSLGPDTAPPDWKALGELFAGFGLRVVGIRGGSPELVESAGLAGLPPVSVADAPSRTPAARPAPEPSPEPAAKSEPAPAPPSPPEPPAASPTLIIDRPLRSGQRIYARGGDVVVLAVVSTGAEVIADGSIHVYAPLRGRALAGASGDTRARILTTRMEAELVSIAGLYRNFEDGLPASVAGKPAQIRLVEEDGKEPRLVVESLSIG